ncbi:uncharacterized protein SCHCODRAFT_01310718 [Schizophyllum commune H4-8]|uniref:uncharacterized protein n=1 Tax=Schizophyllum commune (strain H4-8 / FGSC 9210) TaxID=578458 RepID=UPI00215ECE51|nr:uncharacterized protein SCHCODRAFT_01310718 [Schizophyllum commune H4-8]KAI5891806.1 hypothetical protein SCHCODRAFT_01310718 [Schizophyllum commune H4-8]
MEFPRLRHLSPIIIHGSGETYGRSGTLSYLPKGKNMRGSMDESSARLIASESFVVLAKCVGARCIQVYATIWSFYSCGVVFA